MKARLKKGDEVMVIAGKDRGKSGKILKVLLDKGRAVVQGVNIVKKHRKPTQANPKGGIEELENAIHISNLMIQCPQTKKPTRIGVRKLDTGERVRVSRKSGNLID